MRYLQAAAGAAETVDSSAGLYSQWDQLDRFLALGDESGTYYAGGRKPAPENAGILFRSLAQDGPRTVRAIAAMRGSGRAPKSDPVLWALAMAASPARADTATNTAALEALPEVARTGAELKKFATFVTAERGWGRSLRAAIGRWYLGKPVRQLAMQMVKERRRGPWSHADLLRMAHPKPATQAQSVLFRWAVDGELGRAPVELLEGELKPIHGFDLARKVTDRRSLMALIEDYQLTQEMIPQRWLGAPDVWEALLESMPYCAMLRNLGKLTAMGLIEAQGETTALLAARLVDHRRIERARVHPVTLLQALLQYRERHGVAAICAALEEAYYASFANVMPAGRRIGLTLDASALIPSVVMAMLVARTEPGAAGSKHERLGAVIDALQAAPQSGWRSGADALVVVTAGKSCIPADRPAGVRLVVIAPNAERPVVTGEDSLMLQVVGFDATVPPLVADFLRSD